MRGVRSGQADPSLLPEIMENGLKRWFRRAAGIALLAFCATLWAGFLGWDGNVAGTTRGVPLAGLGPFLADLLLQTFGLAGPLAVVAPTLWGVELASYGVIEGMRQRLATWALGSALAAAAAAGLSPSLAPHLARGPGGMAGDHMLDLLSTPAMAAGIPAESLLLTAATALLGVALMLRSFGVTSVRAWRAAAALRSGERSAARPSTAKVEPSLGGDLPGLEAQAEHEFYEAAVAADERHAVRRPAEKPLPRIAVTARGRAPAFVAAPSAPPRSHPSLGQVDQTPIHVPFEDDPIEDAESQKIARRFAPDCVQTDRAISTADLSDEAGGSWWKLRRFLGNSLHEDPQEPDDAPEPHPSEGPHPLPRRGGAAATERQTPPAGRGLPSLRHLRKAPAPRQSPEHTESALRQKAQLLNEVLAEFDVKGTIGDIRTGPVVTLFELEPARGVKSARVVGLTDDIARSMSATSARIATIPGRNVIGIELPNERRELVVLRELLENEAFRASTATLPIVIGKSSEGAPIIADLARMPHLLVAGTTGSGKSVGINAMILSLLYRFTPEQCRLILIDPKMLELSVYNDIPHLLTPVVTDPQKAIDALGWAVNEMESRYQQMAKVNVRGIDAYNAAVRNAQRQGTGFKRIVQTGFDPATGQPRIERETYTPEPLPYIVIVIDEMADLMMTAGKDLEAAVQRLAQKARAAGIHLITATQRPSVDVITGTIKANLPARLSFRVASKVDSRTILGEQGAEQLLGAGDLLFSPSGSPVRAHAPFISDEEVEAVANELRGLGAPSYVAEIEAPRRETRTSAGASPADTLYEQAVAIVERDGRASTSYLQRRLSIGYNRAADLIERLEANGIVSAADATGRRHVLSRRSASA